MTIPKANDNGTQSITNLNDGHWEVEFDMGPYSSSAADFFFTALGAMTFLARFLASDAVTRHNFGLSAISYTFGQLPVASTEPPAAGLPFLRYEYIIKALANLPRLLSRAEQGFLEVGLDFLFDNELNGKATLMRKSFPQNLFPLAPLTRAEIRIIHCHSTFKYVLAGFPLDAR